MIGFVDCYSGASGSMLLGAIVDAGVPIMDLERVLAGLRLDGFERLEATRVMRGPLQATLVDVLAAPGPPHRPFVAVRAVLRAASLPAGVAERSLAVLERIAEVEGRIHGQEPEAVELHEVGAVDSIVDVVGTVAGLEMLGVGRLYASALPVSTGEIRGGHHGPLPSPAPATLALLAAVCAPLRPFGGGRELVTPTGAALLAELATFEQPAMALRRVGYGAGAAELPWPNVVRLWVGEPRDGE